MLVCERMSRKPVTITSDMPITDALRVMRENQVRRLPVLDQDGKMVGIVSEKDLLYASPSPASSLSIYEMHYMLSRLNVTELMTADVITISPDTHLLLIIDIMIKKHVRRLPVLDGGRLVGMVYLSRVFDYLLERLGG